MRNFSKIHFFSFAAICFMGLLALLSLFFKSTSDTAKYVITTSNQKVYYTNTFKMIKHGIVFEDVHGDSLILIGNIDIEYKKL
jgi:hypothetical protein